MNTGGSLQCSPMLRLSDICSSSYLHLSKMNRQNFVPCSSWSQLLYCDFIWETRVSFLMCPELNSFYLDHFRDQLAVILLWCVLGIHWVLSYIYDILLTHVLQRQSDAENFRAQILRCCIPHLGYAFWGAIISRLLSRLHLLWHSILTETIVLSPLGTPDIFPAEAPRYALL